MPRKTAAERHTDTAPRARPGGESGGALVDVLIAFHHPTRRWLAEILELEGPTTVGRLARRSGLAVGSVSHHLKALHQRGFIEPAPDLARDTRESWWRATPRRLSWTRDDFEAGTMGRRVAEAAETENFRHQVRAVQQWLSSAHDADEQWSRSASSTDTLVSATAEQLADLSRQLAEVIASWSDQCLSDRAKHPDAVRKPVRVIARAFPSAAVRP